MINLAFVNCMDHLWPLLISIAYATGHGALLFFSCPVQFMLPQQVLGDRVLGTLLSILYA
jgi:hypothetical protein